MSQKENLKNLNHEMAQKENPTSCWLSGNGFDLDPCGGGLEVLDHAFLSWVENHDCPQWAEETQGTDDENTLIPPDYECDCEYDGWDGTDYDFSDKPWVYNKETQQWDSPGCTLGLAADWNNNDICCWKSEIVGYRGYGSPCIPGQCYEGTFGDVPCYLPPIEYFYSMYQGEKSIYDTACRLFPDIPILRGGIPKKEQPIMTDMLEYLYMFIPLEEMIEHLEHIKSLGMTPKDYYNKPDEVKDLIYEF